MQVADQPSHSVTFGKPVQRGTTTNSIMVTGKGGISFDLGRDCCRALSTRARRRTEEKMPFARSCFWAEAGDASHRSLDINLTHPIDRGRMPLPALPIAKMEREDGHLFQSQSSTVRDATRSALCVRHCQSSRTSSGGGWWSAKCIDSSGWRASSMANATKRFDFVFGIESPEAPLFHSTSRTRAQKAHYGYTANSFWEVCRIDDATNVRKERRASQLHMSRDRFRVSAAAGPSSDQSPKQEVCLPGWTRQFSPSLNSPPWHPCKAT